jgi:uncharacterized protein
MTPRFFGKAQMIQKIRREDLKPDQVLCEFCTAKCCRYFSLPIETPTDTTDYEYIRWFLLHDRATIFTDGDTWYLLVQTECKELQSDNRCGIYETRPKICREYTTDNCEYDDDWVYERYFERAEQMGEYMEAIFADPKSDDFRSPKPNRLAIVTI